VYDPETGEDLVVAEEPHPEPRPRRSSRSQASCATRRACGGRPPGTWPRFENGAGRPGGGGRPHAPRARRTRSSRCQDEARADGR
jgi:hypothetical protein